jgi:serine/threonine-protein kinase RsbW
MKSERAPLDITLPVTPELTRAVHVRLEAFAAATRLPRKVVFAADTALEELLQNVVDYSGAHEVRLWFAVEGGELRLELADDGRPFNPLAIGQPDLGTSFELRPEGGLGVFLARKMMDRVGYEHRDGCNHLSLAKTLG